jgi:hypothetical protein
VQGSRALAAGAAGIQHSDGRAGAAGPCSDGECLLVVNCVTVQSSTVQCSTVQYDTVRDMLREVWHGVLLMRLCLLLAQKV